jgi:glycosyltransferase involved in cell wall biosynthesis
MKVALVCDDLVQHGGHEKVILDICKIFPQAPLYTTIATRKWQEICRQKGIKLVTSRMQILPFKRGLNRFFAPFFLHILALESFNFDDYDLVISISSRFAHGILTKPQTRHICYMSTVGRMFWEPDIYFAEENFNLPGFLNPLARLFLSWPLSLIRIWDKTAATRPDKFIANSLTTKNRIKKYYGRDSQVIHPGIDLELYSPGREDIYRDYYLVLGRLVSWKRFDLAIEACLKNNEKLKVIGEGPDYFRLKEIAKGSELVEFLGYVDGEEKKKYLQNCRALIHPQYEDFGLVPLEAMACGRPVIAYKKGGVLETVEDEVTGKFFDQQTTESLCQALKEFSQRKYDLKSCSEGAEKFSLKNFENKLKEFIVYLEG